MNLFSAYIKFALFVICIKAPMTLNWLDKNHDISKLKKYDSCQLVQKMKSYKEDSECTQFKIIATDLEIAKSLLVAFSKLDDPFEGLNLRFGWIVNDEKEVPIDGSALEGCSIIIGQDKYLSGFKKLNQANCLFIANKAISEDQHVAFQRHLKQHLNPTSVSLGEFKAGPENAHTLVRRAQSIFLYLNAMKRQDSDCHDSFASGLDIYEACKVTRLAGLSRQLNMFYVVTANNKLSQKSADTVALLVWYYLEGQINIEIETMKERENEVFLVSTEMLDEPIKFVVGHKTGRWWFQHPVTQEYLPCSDKDYQAISNGKLPDAIMALEC